MLGMIVACKIVNFSKFLFIYCELIPHLLRIPRQQLISYRSLIFVD